MIEYFNFFFFFVQKNNNSKGKRKKKKKMNYNVKIVFMITLLPQHFDSEELKILWMLS